MASQIWNIAKSLELKERFREIWFYLTDAAKHIRYKTELYTDPRRLYLGVVEFFGKSCKLLILNIQMTEEILSKYF